MKTHKSEQSANPFEAAFNGPMGGALEKSASIFGKGVHTLQQESIKFMTRRFEDNMKAAEQFGACRSLPDFFAAQQKWFADMTRAYSEEWARYSELMTDALHDAEPAGNGRAERPARTH